MSALREESEHTPVPPVRACGMELRHGAEAGTGADQCLPLPTLLLGTRPAGHVRRALSVKDSVDLTDCDWWL